MLELLGLVKRYGDFTAVDGLDLRVEGGRVLAFLGPNGAGKTTVMRCISGYHLPTEGRVLVGGLSPETKAGKALCGYLPENAPAYTELCPLEYLAWLATVYRLKDERGAADRVISQCGLTGVATQKTASLSKGYRQRLALAAALIHDPQVLVLDEPTAGLDPNQIQEVRRLISALGKKKTVILSTHILQEVEALADEVLIIDRGRKAAYGSLDELCRKKTLEEVFYETTHPA